jgi:hypothetical protein
MCFFSVTADKFKFQVLNTKFQARNGECDRRRARNQTAKEVRKRVVCVAKFQVLSAEF